MNSLYSTILCLVLGAFLTGFFLGAGSVFYLAAERMSL